MGDLCIRTRSVRLWSTNDVVSCDESVVDLVMGALKDGGPVERIWVLWHALSGLGVGVLFIPYGPPMWLVLGFLISSLTIITGVRFVQRRVASI